MNKKDQQWTTENPLWWSFDQKLFVILWSEIRNIRDVIFNFVMNFTDYIGVFIDFVCLKVNHLKRHHFYLRSCFDPAIFKFNVIQSSLFIFLIIFLFIILFYSFSVISFTPLQQNSWAPFSFLNFKQSLFCQPVSLRYNPLLSAILQPFIHKFLSTRR